MIVCVYVHVYVYVCVCVSVCLFCFVLNCFPNAHATTARLKAEQPAC